MTNIITSVDQITPEFLNAVLAFETDNWDLELCTIREYLTQLLEKLWEEQDCFSGKRPFGNSGWSCDLECALVRGGFIENEGDDEEPYPKDQPLAFKIIKRAIRHMTGAEPLQDAK